jgi:Ca-activated chloride channel homolog
MNKKIVIGSAAAASIVIILILMVGFVKMTSLSARTQIVGMDQLLSSEKGEISRNDNYIPSSPSSVRTESDSSSKIKGIPSNGGYVGSYEKTEEQSGFDAMYFANYGTNVYIAPTTDSLSTFGLDVDTASYTISKQYIMRGELPPTDSVRAEEFINYFNYDYQNPTEEFGIYSEIANSPFEDDIKLLRIGIKSREVENRKHATLTFVVDVSGSMNQENRIALVKKSMKFLVEQLEVGDEIAIIKYNTNAELVLSHTSVQEKQKILDAIDTLTPGGSTNAEAGLLLGYKTASEVYNSELSNRVILLSDGVANVGKTGPDAILKEIEKYKAKGIGITTIGVGMGNYNDVLLEQLADKGDGNYYYVNEFNEAKRVFQGQLTGTLETIAKDAKVQVDFNPETVSYYRLVGYENRAIADEEFRDDEKDAGEIGAGHEVTAIYEIKLTNLVETRNIGRVYMRYKNPDTDLPKEISHDISGTIKNFNYVDDNFKLSIAVARYAQILKLSQPPTQIEAVFEIVDGIEKTDETIDDFKIILSNTKRLIEIKQGNSNQRFVEPSQKIEGESNE